MDQNKKFWFTPMDWIPMEWPSIGWRETCIGRTRRTIASKWQDWMVLRERWEMQKISFSSWEQMGNLLGDALPVMLVGWWMKISKEFSLPEICERERSLSLGHFGFVLVPFSCVLFLWSVQYPNLEVCPQEYSRVFRISFVCPCTLCSRPIKVVGEKCCCAHRLHRMPSLASKWRQLPLDFASAEN